MIAITLKSHRDSETKTTSVTYGSTIQAIIDQINQFRQSNARYLKLYNPFGREIPEKLWKTQIHENTTFYVDNL